MSDFRFKESELYSDSNTRISVFESGEIDFDRVPAKWEGSVNDKEHILKSEETLDYLAYIYYSGTEETPDSFWWIIAEANDSILDPFDLDPLIGTPILIPDITEWKLRNL